MTAPSPITGEDAWTRAMDLCARAFVDEPFVVALFGPDPADRAEGLQELFHASAPWPGAEVLGVEADGVLIGTVVVCGPGACHACERDADPAPPEGTPARDEWRFEQNTLRAHRELGEHGWLAKLAVDPSARGAGLGRRLVAAAREWCAGPIVLECQPHRGDFYASCGFSVIGAVEDPGNPDALLMRATP